ncbi:MAG: hypothetical protein NXH79_13935 [Rhodobacteraceae bacterium]|nr:hypothetical protein [Paracoccaceae bacterium]
MLADACADYIYQRKELLPSMRKFAVLHLSGSLEKPKPVKAHLTSMRNVMLYVWVRTVMADHALSVSRNDATEAGTSACDAVAAGIERNGHRVTYTALKQICYAKTPGQAAARQIAGEIIKASRHARDAGIIPTHLLDRAYWGV